MLYSTKNPYPDLRDPRRGLKRHCRRPGEYCWEQPICCVIIPRRPVSPRPASLHLDDSQHNADLEVLSGVSGRKRMLSQALKEILAPANHFVVLPHTVWKCLLLQHTRIYSRRGWLRSNSQRVLWHILL
jgi:hypothetical protein